LGLDGAKDSTVGEIDDAVLLAGPHVLPPLELQTNLASPHALPWIVARLRAPGGCPWDREQTHQSLRPFLLEEAYEVHDALERGASPQLAGELGDLLLQIVLHAQLAAEAGAFDLSDVYRAIAAKIIRRHPHVFGEGDASTVGQVLRNWEQIKATERLADSSAAAEGRPETQTAGLPEAFRGLARSLPALAYSQEMQARAAALGYDWPDFEGVIEKLEEEAVELLEADDPARRVEEFGDLLLVLVNLARKMDIDAEAALRAANQKFARRFALVERYAAERGRSLDRMTFEELDELWDAAKTEAARGARREDEQ
jgi:MazG family protein